MKLHPKYDFTEDIWMADYIKSYDRQDGDVNTKVRSSWYAMAIKLVPAWEKFKAWRKSSLAHDVSKKLESAQNNQLQLEDSKSRRSLRYEQQCPNDQNNIDMEYDSRKTLKSVPIDKL